MKHSAYFDGTIEELTVEPKKYFERVSFWRFVEKTKDEYFILCSLKGAKNFKLKIKIEKTEYDRSKVGNEVGVYLNFDYQFTCIYGDTEERKPIIINVEKSY